MSLEFVVSFFLEEEDLRVRTVPPDKRVFSSVWLKSRLAEELSFFLLFTVRPIFECAKAIVIKLDGMTVNVISNSGELQDVEGGETCWLG